MKPSTILLHILGDQIEEAGLLSSRLYDAGRDDTAADAAMDRLIARYEALAARAAGPDRIIGFTGTRAGMTAEQRREVIGWLTGATEAHHGDCEGSDAEFHALCLTADIPVVIHPPTDPRHRAFCQDAALVLPAAPYIERNRAIVDAVHELIACPREAGEPPAPARGKGTWATIRYARKQPDVTLRQSPGTWRKTLRTDRAGPAGTT